MEIITAFETQPWLFITTIIFLGLTVGSFLNVVIHRLPIMLENEWRNECQSFLEITPDEKESTYINLAKPNSTCPSCGHEIRIWENIPVLSYLFLKGKCSSCGTHISFQYPLIEIITAALSVTVAIYFGVTMQTVLALILTWSLVSLTMIDAKKQLLPDNITLPLLWLGLIANSFNLFTDLQSAVYGAVFGYMILWIVYQVFKLLTGKEGMGFGDFKLLAALGAWTGIEMLPLIILISSLVGAVIGISLIVFKRHERSVPIPFGPYLAIAGWIVLIWGANIKLWLNI